MQEKTSEPGRNDLGEVRECACGGVNLAMGPVTLHFSAAEVELLSDLVDAATRMVEEGGTKKKKRHHKGKDYSTVH